MEFDEVLQFLYAGRYNALLDVNPEELEGTSQLLIKLLQGYAVARTKSERYGRIQVRQYLYEIMQTDDLHAKFLGNIIACLLFPHATTYKHLQKYVEELTGLWEFSSELEKQGLKSWEKVYVGLKYLSVIYAENNKEDLQQLIDAMRSMHSEEPFHNGLCETFLYSAFIFAGDQNLAKEYMLKSRQNFQVANNDFERAMTQNLRG